MSPGNKYHAGKPPPQAGVFFYDLIMETFLIIVGEPRSKERPQWNNGRAYTPPKTREAEKVIRQAYLNRFANRRHKGHLRVDLEFYMESWRRKDLDNMEKLVLDALNDLAYDDDSQIVVKNSFKQVDKNVLPQTRIRITEIENG